jgi:hypothetical protein
MSKCSLNMYYIWCMYWCMYEVCNSPWASWDLVPSQIGLVKWVLGLGLYWMINFFVDVTNFKWGGGKCQFSSILTEKCQDHFHLYKYTKRQEWMNDLRRLKLAGESEPWNVAGGARGPGPGQVRSSPASLSRSSLARCLCARFGAGGGIFSPPSVAGFIFAANTISFLRH